MFLTVLAVSTASVVSAQPQVEPDCAGNTLEMNACFAEAVARAEAEMERYHRAAVAHVRSQEHGILPHVGVSAAVHMEWAQAEYLDYRSAECAAVYEHLAEGTIRTLEALSCHLELANARTRQIWQRWLTYPDGTPPILPEPVAVMAE